MCPQTVRRSRSLPLGTRIPKPLDTNRFLGGELHASGFEVLDDAVFVLDDVSDVAVKPGAQYHPARSN